jgi:hypothetical protein
VSRSEDGRAVVALAQGNVLVSLTESDCFSEARVAQPLNAQVGDRASRAVRGIALVIRRRQDDGGRVLT